MERHDAAIHDRIRHWHDHLTERLPHRVKYPPVRLYIHPGNNLGSYDTGTKEIMLNKVYLHLCEDDAVDELLAHELCHHWAYEIMPLCQTHGEFFFYLLRHVCGFKNAKSTADLEAPKELRKKVAQTLRQMEVLNDLNKRHGEATETS